MEGKKGGERERRAEIKQIRDRKRGKDAATGESTVVQTYKTASAPFRRCKSLLENIGSVCDRTVFALYSKNSLH